MEYNTSTVLTLQVDLQTESVTEKMQTTHIISVGKLTQTLL